MRPKTAKSGSYTEALLGSAVILSGDAANAAAESLDPIPAGSEMNN